MQLPYLQMRPKQHHHQAHSHHQAVDHHHRPNYYLYLPPGLLRVDRLFRPMPHPPGSNVQPCALRLPQVRLWSSPKADNHHSQAHIHALPNPGLLPCNGLHVPERVDPS